MCHSAALCNANRSLFLFFLCCRNVAIPHPGTSYNPSKKDHEDLIESVIEFEEKIIRKEDHLNRVTTSMFDKMTAQQRDEARRKEMSAGIEELEGIGADVTNGKFRLNFIKIICLLLAA